MNWGKKGQIPVEDIAAKITGSVEKYPINTESTPEKYPGKLKIAQKNKAKPVGKTAQRIIDLVISNPMITREQMAERIGISLEGIKKNIKNLRDRGILVHEGSTKSGYWRIVVK